ncbi:MAG: hypothetical protein N2442_01770 [Spirochaetes bacterium]|nr:hypothetical protein [Spirochaetota bacterium]
MNWYKAQLRLRSSLATPLVGDTLFGHVCWGIVRTKGEKDLLEFLESCEQDPTFFSISSAFPADTLPIPILPSSKETLTPSLSQYGKKKKNKKKRYIPSRVLLEQTEPINRERLNQLLEISEETFVFQSATRLHNTINRITGTTEGPTGLFTGDELTLAHSTPPPALTIELLKYPKLVDLYIVSRKSKEVVHSLLEDAFKYGYGADTSTGKGWIEVTDIMDIQVRSKGNRYLSLGPFIPTDEERRQINHFSYELFIRKGKIGSEFVHFMNPFKKPILLYREGSSFALTTHKPVIGTILKGIHTEEMIRHAAHTPILPFLAEEG